MGFKVQDLFLDVEGDKVTVKGTAASQEEKEKIVLLLGNSEGIGSVDDQLQVSNPEPAAPRPSTTTSSRATASPRSPSRSTATPTNTI